MKNRILMKHPIAVALIGALLWVHAAEATEALPEPLRACAAMRNDVERLACYDKAVAHMESGSVAPSAENMFGASTAIAPARKTDHEAKDEELKQITATVVSLSRSGSGLVTLALDNEQVWHQEDADVTLIVEIGDSVTISRASLGTFRLTDKRGHSSRFKRVR
jgi:catalase (peroxidase I)